MADAGTTSGGSVAPPLRRLPPLSGFHAAGPGVTLTPLDPRARLSIQAGEDSLAVIEEALGFALPRRPKTSAGSGGVAVLWLGPDEWLVIGEPGASAAAAQQADRFRRLREATGETACVVDISHRDVAIAVEGPAAQAVIAAGCPQDIGQRSFPVGAAARTVLSKAEIVLWRRSKARFEIECRRSFADYAWMFLAEAARDPAV